MNPSVIFIYNFEKSFFTVFDTVSQSVILNKTVWSVH